MASRVKTLSPSLKQSIATEARYELARRYSQANAYYNDHQFSLNALVT